jgi:hypothetical protein
MDAPQIIAFVGIGLTILTSTTALTWFVASQFSGVRAMFWKALDDHEAKDQSRHASLCEQIKQIQLRNAAIDGRDRKILSAKG